LVELMIVVVIIAILATLSVYGVRNYIKVSRTAEVTSVINAIRAGQEAYREETFQYLDVSGSYTNLYPSGAPKGTTKYAWGDTGMVGGKDLGKNFAALGVSPSGPVMFGYACIAGAAGDDPGTPDGAGKTFNWPSEPPEVWYVIRAAGDQDNDGEQSVFIASSFTNEIYYHQRIE
jgi:type II secretory pathway pseudopilin PulG